MGHDHRFLCLRDQRASWAHTARSQNARVCAGICVLTLSLAGIAASAQEPAPSIDRSADASADPFAIAFEGVVEPLGEDPSDIDLLLPPDAVDLDSFDPPRGPRVVRSLGTGVASYYGRRFHGRLTANGERFDMAAMTAAHRTLPFGSMVRVTNPRNGLSVTVRINDRGPFIAGRTIDLSRGAAERIDMITRGHERVELELVAP